MLARSAVLGVLLAAAIATAGGRAQGFSERRCDWTNQVPVTPWASFGPSPKNLIAAAPRH